MARWWELAYETGEPVELPGLPQPMYPPNARDLGKTPTMSAAEVIAYKRTVARLGRWTWAPTSWDRAYSNTFAHGKAGGNVRDSGVAGVQRQAGLEAANGWIEEETFDLLRSVKVPAGLPNAGQLAMDSVARRLLLEAWEAAAARPAGPAALADLRLETTPGDPHWGGAGDVMARFVEPFMVEHGMRLGSGKRTPAENRAVGGSKTSDHLTTKSTTAARDFPTFSGEAAARALAEALGSTSWRPDSFDAVGFTAGGRSFRAQILWGARIDHADHIHVGISPA